MSSPLVPPVCKVEKLVNKPPGLWLFEQEEEQGPSRVGPAVPRNWWSTWESSCIKVSHTCRGLLYGQIYSAI